MNVSGRRILKTTAAVVGLGALGALGSGTAFAATPADLGGAPTSHGVGSVDTVGSSSPTSAKGSGLHTFAMPKMATHIAEPSTRYDDSNYDDNNGDSSNYGVDPNNGYDDNSYDNNNYNNNNNNGYYNNDGNGYYNNGSSHRDGLLGGGLLGGNN